VRPSDNKGALAFEARRYLYDRGPTGGAETRWVAVETPVAIEFSGAPHAVMLATPADLEDFAIGFALTEGVVERANEIRAVEISSSADGVTLNVALVGERLQAHLARRRALVGRTSCGLCGVEDFAALPRPSPAPAAAPVAPRAVAAALSAFSGRQTLNALTHAVHGAAWSDREGRLTDVREDVGRHNALDKLIGALALKGVDPTTGFAVVSSRSSLEMVVKIARFGASTLVSLSGPTTMALERADALGVTLIAVAREDYALCFAPRRSTREDAA